jgi:two-component system LytT family response regulator
MDIRTIVVDRDPSGRRDLCTLLVTDPEIDLVAQCASFKEAINSIIKNRPSLIFLNLDLEVNVLDYARMVRSLENGILPTIILTGSVQDLTSQVASPFRLTKPISHGHLTKALGIAKIRAETQSRNEQGPYIQRRMDGHSRRVVVRSKGRFILLRAEDVDWIQAKGNNVCIHAGNESIVQRGTISACEANLDHARFVRIHRSVIVNIDNVKELRPWPTGEYVVLMRNGKELTMSRGYRALVSLFLGGLDHITNLDTKSEVPLTPPRMRGAPQRICQREPEYLKAFPT